MTSYIGLDIGGTKIAGTVLSEMGEERASCRLATPKTYPAFLEACAQAISELRTEGPVGLCLAGGIDEDKGTANCSNLPLKGHTLRDDLASKTGRRIRIANDANCMALVEYMEGAGRGAKSLYGLILGTGVGGGYIFNGRIVAGLNGMAGELGQLPLPFREPEDGPFAPSCACHQKGCIEKSLCGSGLERLYTFMTGQESTSPAIAEAARAGEAQALRVLDRYFEVAAKAMVTIMHSFDPHVVVVAGGLNDLPGFYDEVPKRVLKYAVFSASVPQLVKAAFGPESGLRGAAWLWRK